MSIPLQNNVTASFNAADKSMAEDLIHVCIEKYKKKTFEEQ